MLKKLLADVVILVVGKPAEPIAELILSKKPVNEFLIAKKMDITINQTRNILYKLSDVGLVFSERKKDKKKGWYTYFWKIETIKSLDFLKNILNKRIDYINQQSSLRESKQFYECKRCGIELNEDDALLQEFTCDECGGIFTIKNNARLLRELKKRSDQMKEEIELIDVELGKEQAKVEKKKAREAVKLAKEKEEKRKEMKALRDAKKKLTKKTVKKKVVKKKVVKKKSLLKGALKKVVKKVRKK